MAGLDDPPTQIGSADCTGRGRWPTPSNCQRSPWCDANSSASAARTASMASSSSRPRSANGTSRASNSPSTCPAPTPRIARPPESASSVAHALATASGWRYGSTYTWLSSRTRSVTAARYESVATVSHHVVLIASAWAAGMATWSHTAT